MSTTTKVGNYYDWVPCQPAQAKADMRLVGKMVEMFPALPTHRHPRPKRLPYG